MARSVAAPILPSDMEDPTGVDSLERQAMAEFRRRLRAVLKGYRARVDMIPATLVVNARYTYDLSQAALNSILTNMDTFIDEIMLQGGPDRLWFFDAFVNLAYQKGTAQTRANLAKQSPVYRADRDSMATILRSEPYQRRITLLRTREFEEMKGFTQEMKTDLARTLTDGMARGRGPLEISRNVSEQMGIEQYRADRIARTEVTTALRRARWDESDDAADTYGLKFLQMHLSALSPTTRRSHALRHGKLFTTEQVRDWYAQDANGINCKCSQTQVLVDNEGKPLVPGTVDRARAAAAKYESQQSE